MRPLIFLHLAALFCAVQGRRLRENKLNQDDDQRLWWRSEDSLFTDESGNSGKDRADNTERSAVELSLASRNSKTNPNLIKKRDNTEDDVFQAPVSKAKRSQIKSKLPLASIKQLKQLQDKVLIWSPTRTNRRRRSTESLAESSENITVHGNATSPSMEPGRRPRRQRRRRITISIDAKGLPPGYKRADLDTSSPSTGTPQVLVPGDEASRSDVWKQSTHVDRQRPYVIQHSVQGNSFQYDHGQRHSRKNTVDSSELLSEEIVALAHELSQVQDKLSRLNDAVLQQVAGQMKAAERLESLLVAHGKTATKNSKHTRRLFKRLKRSCCQCQRKAGPSEGVAASKRRGGQKRKQGRFGGEKEKIKPLGHTATGTVNSTGDCMHVGVKSDVSSPTNKTSAFTTTTRTVPIVTTRTTTTAPTVAKRTTPAAKTRSTPRFNRSTSRPLSTKTTTPVTQTRTTQPAAFTKHSSAATTTIAATTTTSKCQKQVADAHEDGEPNDDDGGDDDDNDDDDNSTSEEESEEDSKEKESEEGEGTSEDSDVNGDDEADDEENDGTSEDEKDTEEMTNQTSEMEDKKNEKDKKERIDRYDLLGNNDTVEDRHHEHSSKDLTEENNGTRSTEHASESNSDTSDNVVLQYPQLAPYTTEEKDGGILKPTSDPSPHSVNKTDRNANQSQKATDISTTNRETVESLHIVEDASNTKGTSEKTSSGGEQEILGATSRGSELHGTGEVDTHAPTTDGRYVLIDSQEHVTDAPDLVTDTTGTRAHATSAQGHGIDTEYHTTAAGDHSAVGRGHTTDVQKRTISPSENTVYSQDHITTSRGLQIEYQEQNSENSGDLMHIRHVTNKEYTETDPANDFSTLQNLIEDTNRHGSDDGRDTFSSAPVNADDFTTRQNIPAIDTEISGSRTKDEVPVSNEEGRPSKMPQAHDDNFQIPIFQTSSDNLNLQEATTKITTTSINLDKLVGETQSPTTDTNVGTGTPVQKVGKEGTQHDKDVSTTTASNMYYPFKDAPFVNGEDHVNMEGSDEKKHEDKNASKTLASLETAKSPLELNTERGDNTVDVELSTEQNTPGTDRGFRLDSEGLSPIHQSTLAQNFTVGEDAGGDRSHWTSSQQSTPASHATAGGSLSMSSQQSDSAVYTIAHNTAEDNRDSPSPHSTPDFLSVVTQATHRSPVTSQASVFDSNTSADEGNAVLTEMSHQNLKTSLHFTEHFDTTTVPAESASTPSLNPIVHAATSGIVYSTAGRMHTESMAPSSTTMNIGSELIMTTTSSTTLKTHPQEDTPFFASTSSSSAASTAITTSGATAAPATMTTQPETTTATTSPTTATTTQLLTTTTATPSTTSTSTTTTPWTTTSKTTTTPATTNTPTTTSTTPSRRTTATTRSRNTTTVPTKTSPPVLTTPETEVYLEVDLTTGHVDGEALPGMTWVVRPAAPSNARVTRRRTRRSTTLEDRQCEMQGVLKFTFTPPPPTRRPPDRYGRRSADDDVGGGSGGGGREHLLLDMWFRNPRRWVFNLGDSIANNGFSGDGSVQENDCEVQGYGSTFSVYGSDKHTNVREKLLHSDGTFTFNKLTLVVSDQTILWNNHRGKADTVRHFSLFALAGQSDSQGEVNYDVYLGLNRVIDGSYRSGSGLCRVQARWLDGESPST